MARPLRIEFEGAVYHVTSRGNAKKDIFEDDVDREVFLKVLDEVIKRFNWLCHAYCLMNNHYHLLIETPEGNLSKGMRQLNGVYTQRHNHRHNKTGHVFQGRYKAILIDKESYLLEVSRYVVLNPVRAMLVKRPDDWKWSSYLATAGIAKTPEYLTTDWILGRFGNNKAEAELRYREFVMNGIKKEESPWKRLQGQVLLGDERFIERFSDLLSKKRDIREIPRYQRYASRPPLEELFKDTEIEKNKRDKRICDAHIRYGYTLKEIAEYLGIHYTTVSKIIKSGVRS